MKLVLLGKVLVEGKAFQATHACIGCYRLELQSAPKDTS